MKTRTSHSVLSAQEVYDLTGIKCLEQKVYAIAGNLEVWGWVSECMQVFFREGDASMCSTNQIEILWN